MIINTVRSAKRRQRDLDQMLADTAVPNRPGCSSEGSIATLIADLAELCARRRDHPYALAVTEADARQARQRVEGLIRGRRIRTANQPLKELA